MQRYAWIFAGDGKTKTTANTGLALRRAGMGLKLYFAQFIRLSPYNEFKALERFPGPIILFARVQPRVLPNEGYSINDIPAGFGCSGCSLGARCISPRCLSFPFYPQRRTGAGMLPSKNNAHPFHLWKSASTGWDQLSCRIWGPKLIR